MPPVQDDGVIADVVVSILIRPEGRMPPVMLFCACPGCTSFNPHPARRPDATGKFSIARITSTRFNPHPARRPDATYSSPSPCLPPCRFNPHPARRPDATLKVAMCAYVPIPFQSSSGPKAGCHYADIPGVHVTIGFNPHPARRPDATNAEGEERYHEKGFNPHPARRPDATGVC